MKNLKLILALSLSLLLVSCSAAENSSSQGEKISSPSVPSVSQPETDRWANFTDIAGGGIDRTGEDVKGLILNYAVGWNFDHSAYVKIYHEDRFFGGTISFPTSTYEIYYGNDLPTLFCTDNSYTISYNDFISSETTIKGIITTDSLNDVVFYPYYNDDGDNLFMVCSRDEDSEQLFESRTHLALPDGTEVHVQPFGIYLALTDGGENGGRYAFSLDDIRTGSSNFIEAEVTFDSIYVCGITHNENDPIYGTRAHGEILSFDDIKILNSY